jgi:hypothetical protein
LDIDTYRYWLAGWCLEVPFPLPELGRAGGEPDIRVRLVQPGALDGLRQRPQGYAEFTADGAILLDFAPEVRFLVSLTEIWIDAREGVTPLVRDYLLGVASGAIAFLRGRLPYHASALRFGDAAIAITGPSGAGKSTLAACLAARGHAVLADDVAILSLNRQGDPPLLWPGCARLKMSAASLAALGLDATSLARGSDKMDGTARFHLLTAADAPRRPLPLTTVYVLEETQGDTPYSLLPAKGVSAFRHLAPGLYREEIGRLVRPASELFDALGRLALGVRTRVLRRPFDLTGLDHLADLIEEDQAGAGAG